MASNSPPVDTYAQLKERLLQLYDLWERTHCNRFLAIPLMGSERPVEILAKIRLLCPLGEENTKFFRYHFFLRLCSKLLPLGCWYMWRASKPLCIT